MEYVQCNQCHAIKVNFRKQQTSVWKAGALCELITKCYLRIAKYNMQMRNANTLCELQMLYANYQNANYQPAIYFLLCYVYV